MKIAALETMSANTILSSPVKPRDLAQVAKKRGYEAVALTDVDFSFGLPEFYQAAKEAGIKPILGLSARLSGLMDDQRRYDLVFLAKNQAGYEALMRLSSAACIQTDDLQSNRVLTPGQVKKYFHDLVVIVPASPASELRMMFDQGMSVEEGCHYVEALAGLLDESCDLYLGVYASLLLQDYDDYVKQLAAALADKNGDKGLNFQPGLVAVEDVRYLDPEDQFLVKVMDAIKHKRVMSSQEITDKIAEKGSHALAPAQDLADRCQKYGLEAALENSWVIASKCQAEIPFQKPQLPVFAQNVCPTSGEYLAQLANAGLKRIAASLPPARRAEYQKRLDYELQVIHQMGFDDYFLIVADIVANCRKQGVLLGPGRGSAAGSLVAYALDITRVDPLKYGLLFERFLNPARSTMPDIDLDFTSEGQKIAIDYVYRKYGQVARPGQGSDRVARILALTALKAKSALDRVGAVFGLKPPAIAKLKQAMGQQTRLKQAYDQELAFRSLLSASPLNRLVYQTALRLEDLPADTGTHAPGVVISQDSLAARTGLMKGKEKPLWTVQQTKEYVEKYGLLKIDFLVLTNLEFFGKVVKRIQAEGVKLVPEQIPLDDPATYRLFQRGQTSLIFQFGSGEMQKFLRQLHPETFADLCAMTALYRPGPKDSIPDYIARKHGKQAAVYPDPSLAPILQETYGYFVYQEQIIQAAQAYAGFSLAQADIFRRAISKKNARLLQDERQRFIEGAKQMGKSAEQAGQVFDQIAPFADYGFNKSHAVAYSLFSYWEAYLEVHFPREFFVEMLDQSRGKDREQAINDARQLGVAVFGPDINQSKSTFSLVKGRICVGFKSILGLSRELIAAITGMPKPITSFDDFLGKLEPDLRKEQALRSLIEAGAFDSLGEDRNELLATLSDRLDNAKLSLDSPMLQQILSIKPYTGEKARPDQKIAMELKAMGFTVTVPLLLQAKLNLGPRFKAGNFAQLPVGGRGSVIAEYKESRDWVAKRGRNAGAPGTNAAFFDGESQEWVTLFPEAYQRYRQLLKPGGIYLLDLVKKEDNYKQREYSLELRALKALSGKEIAAAKKTREEGEAVTDIQQRRVEKYFDQHYQDMKRLADFSLKEEANAIAQLRSFRIKPDKHGEEMATTIFADSTGSYKVMIFAEQLARLHPDLVQGGYYVLRLEAIKGYPDPSQLEFKLYQLKQFHLRS